MRQTVVAGNWKMNKTPSQTTELINELKPLVADSKNKCIVCVPFTNLANAIEACKRADVEPIVRAIRGGTDGSQLSFKGLPCPNLGTGGFAYHGPYEHATMEGMDKAVNVMLELIKLYAE